MSVRERQMVSLKNKDYLMDYQCLQIKKIKSARTQTTAV